MLVPTYAPIFMMIGIATLLATVFFVGHNLLGKQAKYSEERMQPYESGSPSDGGKYVKRSVKFYLTAILFVGFDIEVGDGERIPDEVLEAAQAALSEILATPADVADAVLYAVSQPPRVHIAEIVVRPNKDLNL